MGLGASHLGIAKVKIDGLGVADVQDPIGLRREPCPHLQGGEEDTSVLWQETLPLLDSRGTDTSPQRSHRAPHATWVLPLAVPPVSCVSPQHPTQLAGA